MKGHVLSYEPTCNPQLSAVGREHPTLSLSRETLYIKDMYSFISLSTVLDQGFMAWLCHLDAHLAFSSHCPSII